MDKKDNRGGNRPGAGRPKTDNPPRTLRGFKLTDEEWKIMNELAAEQGMSAREYMTWLVSLDKRRSNPANKTANGRAITDDELSVLIAEQSLGEDDISSDFEEALGDLYGGTGRCVFTVRQIKTKKPSDNIRLSDKLKEKGIHATAPCPGRVNIRVK